MLRHIDPVISAELLYVLMLMCMGTIWCCAMSITPP